MGYHNILLDNESSKLCTVVLPWGKYEYLRLPMGLCNAPDIFQEKMAELMQDFEFVEPTLMMCWFFQMGPLRIISANWSKF
jgi:hypothetical protein